MINSAILSLLIYNRNSFTMNTLHKVLISVYCSLIMLTARVSVFYNILLAVVRTINLVRPFMKQKVRYVVIMAVLCPIFWTPLAAGQLNFFINDAKYDYMLFTPYLGAKWLGLVGLQLNIVIPFVLPSLIALVCLLVQAAVLRKSEVVEFHHNNRQRAITMTITLLTLLFFICNTTFALLFYVDMFTLFVTCLEPHYRFVIGCVMTGTLTFVNAAMNPIIMIYRGSRLRTFVLNMRSHVLLENKRSNSSTC